MGIFLTRSLVTIGLVSAMAGCPKGIPGRGSSKVDPNTCGNYAVSDAGRKLYAFLDASARLDVALQDTVSVLRTSCVIMGKELGMSVTKLTGETRDVCNAVTAEIQNNLKIGLKAEAELKVDYKPAVCTVDASVMAKAAAQCEAKAESDISVTCDGTCSGTCNGTCNGTCEGSAGTGGSGGQCDGQCSGTCEGSCSGGCDGSADVNASAQCKAEAEVKASVDVNCTEPEFNVTADAALIVDPSKIENTLRALKAGMPKVLSVKARMRPLGAAARSWGIAAGELGEAGADLAASFKDQALCISGQISGAVGMIGNIQANVSVSVEVSASVSGSAGVN